MSVIRLNNVSKFYDGTPVLREVFFRLSEGERVGLIGKNGAGKTTLLKLILGQEPPTEGTVEVDDGIRIGYFSQFSELNDEKTIVEVLDDLFADIHALEEALFEVEIAFEENPQGDEMDRLLLRQANLLEEMDRLGGYDYGYKIDTVLTRLGFSEAHRDAAHRRSFPAAGATARRWRRSCWKRPTCC